MTGAMPSDARGRRYRVLMVASHPVQYQSPLFRHMAMHPRLDIKVAYCSRQGADPGADEDFGIDVTWDVPLLEGYPSVDVRNRSPRPGLGRFWGLLNPGLWNVIRRGGFDAVVIYTGYRYASFWIALAAAKVSGTPVLFGTDAHELAARDQSRWKAWLKCRLWPWLFGIADVVIVPSRGGVGLMRSLGIPEERVVLTPFVVDNDWWSKQADHADTAALRRTWAIPTDAVVFLFCAKLQSWKRPLDLLRAFARASAAGSYLVYVGEGSQRAALEAEAKALCVSERVRFHGFANQSELPAIYCAADMLVLPSEYEPFGVVVNEAMLCGRPVAVSDRVGAAADLVRDGQNGFVFSCGNLDALAGILCDAAQDKSRLNAMGAAARSRMQTWSPQENIEGLLRAIELAVGKGTPA